MPLSEEELRLLEQMERALVEEDPKFASTLRGTSLRRSARRRAAVAGFFFLAGVTVMMTGLIIKLELVGVAGFVVMLGSATVFLRSIKGQQGVAAEAQSAAASSGHPSGLGVIDGGKSSRLRRSRTRRPAKGSGSFMERMEERWRRRREDNGGF